MRWRYKFHTLAITIFLLSIVAWGCSDETNLVSTTDSDLLKENLSFHSPNFTNIRPRKRIPDKHTCYGEGSSPPFNWDLAPPGTKSFALIGEDADHDTGIWVHWVIYNIPASLNSLPEGISTSTEVLHDGTTQGFNDHKTLGYQGPCPRQGIRIHYSLGNDKPEPPHRIYFRLYALDLENVGLGPRATKDDLISAMSGHILTEAETMGKYQAEPFIVQKEELGIATCAVRSCDTPTPISTLSPTATP